MLLVVELYTRASNHTVNR